MILLALVFALPGAAILGLGLFCFFRDRRHLPYFSQAGEGTVIGFTEPDDEGFVRPRVQFVHDAVTVIITGSVSSNPPGYRIGQRVAVRYPPGRIRAAIIADFRHLHLFNVSCLVFGSASIGTAILLVVLKLVAR